MVEEFHATDPYVGPWKLLYGWGTLNSNVWLPSISELIGYDADSYFDFNAGHNAAMQGLGCTEKHWVDKSGGEQWRYFVQYNTSGGGAAIWKACNRESAWTRSPDIGLPNSPWSVKDATTFIGHPVTCISACAVHPAVACKTQTACFAENTGLPVV